MPNQHQQTKTARAIAFGMIAASLTMLLLAALGIAPQLLWPAIGLLVINVVLLVVFK